MKAKGPEFIRFFKPILQILKQSGGSGTTSEVIDRAIELLGISESEQEAVLKNGQSRVRNQVQWARFYLVRAGYLDSSLHGVWNLTEKGAQTDLSTFNAYDVFQLVQKGVQAEKKKKKELQEPFIDEDDESSVEAPDYKSELLALIKSLPPSGFERLCQRLLRESGFRRLSLPEEVAMAASTELESYRSIHSSALTFYSSANAIKVPSLRLKSGIFEAPWRAVQIRAL